MIHHKLRQNQDVDVYIEDWQMQNYERYCTKFGVEPKLRNNETDYKFASFKVTICDIIFNFIFPTTSSPLNHIYEFDLDICQIFYSFRMDSIYMKIKLFDDHDKFEHYHLIDKNITNVYNKQFDLLSARRYW